jgi:putative flippase GtrA
MMLYSLLRQFVTFCGVGAINTALSLTIILVLSELAGFHHVIANIIGYAAGLVVGFFLHRGITFAKTAQSGSGLSHQAKSFLIVFAIGYVAQLLLLLLLVDVFGWHEALSQILAVGLYTIISFIGNRQITFKAQPKASP